MYTENKTNPSKRERGIIVQLKRFKLLLSSLQYYYEYEHAYNNGSAISSDEDDDDDIVNSKANYEMNELHKYLSYTYRLIESFVSNSSLYEHVLPRLEKEVRETSKESIGSIACKFNCSVSSLRTDNPHLHCYTDDEVLPQNTFIKLRSIAQSNECLEELTKQIMKNVSSSKDHKTETGEELYNGAAMHTLDDLSSVLSNIHDDASLNSIIMLEQSEQDVKQLEKQKEKHFLEVREKQEKNENYIVMEKCIENNVHKIKTVRDVDKSSSCDNLVAGETKSINNDDDEWESECVSIPSKEPSPLPIPELMKETSPSLQQYEECELELYENDTSNLHESLENSPSACIPRVLSSAAVAFDKNITVPKLTFTGIAHKAKSTSNTPHNDNACSNTTDVKYKNSDSKIVVDIDANRFCKNENGSSGEIDLRKDKLESVTELSSSELEQQYVYETSSSSSSSELKFYEEQELEDHDEELEEECYEEEEFDTIANIAQSYNASVEEILHWNPFLRSYDIDQPLPANLSIVLPRK